MGTLIVGYVLNWHPGVNKGQIVVKLQNGRTVPLPVETADEFAALAAILNESPVFMMPNGSISTDWESPGGD